MITKINKKLAREILERVRVDQVMRKRFIAGKAQWGKRIDRKNTGWLKRVVKQHGWLTISLVGKKASHGAWLLVQHADHDVKFQKKVLIMMNEIYKRNRKEIEPANLAYLTDRILVHEKKPQIFGTQFIRKKGKKEFKSFPIKNKKSVNRRRRNYGLPSLEENQKRIHREYKRLESKSRAVKVKNKRHHGR